MNTYSHIKNTLIKTSIACALISAVSCNKIEKPEDTKEIAKDQNEELYDNSRKEKDALFLVNAAEINLKEIQLGQLAQQTSKTEDVKELGKMMEEAHRKSLDELIVLAHKKSIAIPKSLTDDAIEANKQLLNTMESSFDIEYCNMMVTAHREAITLFDVASTEATDADIKAWAANMLPNLHLHLDHAMDCQKKYDVKAK